jgi:hypothetical protein
VADVDEGDRVRLIIDEKRTNDTYLGEIDEIASERDDLGGFVSVVFMADDRTVFDLEAQYDPRSGWSDLTASERLYHDAETKFIEHGPVDDLSPVSLGVELDALRVGVEATHWTGDRFRVVVPPHEREYDNKALAYNIDGGTNVVEKLDPAEVETCRRITESTGETDS